MFKSLVRRFFAMALSFCLVGAILATQAYASEFWDAGISEETIVFVENVWVFSGDCSYGVFDDNPERFSRSLEELWGLYQVVPACDRELPDVTAAVDRLFSVMENQAVIYAGGASSGSSAQALVSGYANIANRSINGSQIRGDGSFACSDTAYFLVGLVTTTAVAIALLCAVYENPCEDAVA